MTDNINVISSVWEGIFVDENLYRILENNGFSMDNVKNYNESRFYKSSYDNPSQLELFNEQIEEKVPWDTFQENLILKLMQYRCIPESFYQNIFDIISSINTSQKCEIYYIDEDDYSTTINSIEFAIIYPWNMLLFNWGDKFLNYKITKRQIRFVQCASN